MLRLILSLLCRGICLLRVPIKAIVAKLGPWLFVKYLELEADRDLTRANADSVRTRIVDTIQTRIDKARAKAEKKGLAHVWGEVWQFAAWVMKSDRIQQQADRVNAEPAKVGSFGG